MHFGVIEGFNRPHIDSDLWPERIDLLWRFNRNLKDFAPRAAGVAEAPWLAAKRGIELQGMCCTPCLDYGINGRIFSQTIPSLSPMSYGDAAQNS
jgi:hypothetical protein